ncbi:SLC13 family permease [Cytobacillus oceanisediminis]|uniref:SLC13 family permease n=1 Tax=Cytobacillus oceanisediminis TaxID=665099 RepID=UPI00186475C3|nr:DASS family sodium-coupled anion symporter [Cytobacillus oceanisediminis]MBY0157220.1 DASS family sodium-coupled anion symporter [Cytobacillus firmus]QOK28121.1 DASS family sodium-coupled anion symporter [Cytobacillus oceanisediminis]USK46387.1 DASS family sodium-coupled anion symporter [Cytobacillus oceanisediminis]
MTYLKSFWSQMWHWNDQVKVLPKSLLSLLTSGNSSAAEKLAVTEKTKITSQNGANLEPEQNKKTNYNRSQLIGLFTGPALFLLISFFVSPEELPIEAAKVLAIVAWVATWWVTEAIPIPLTSLLPIILFPLFGIMETGEVSASYGDSLIFLFAGSFMIALTMEKWNLHRRIALGIISLIGTNPSMIILGFMVATGFLSMWISNTATTMLMVPMALAVTKQVSDSLENNNINVNTTPGQFPFGTALMLGTAYAATLGGFGTLIGAPANTILAATVKSLYSVEISFARWMLFGVPLVVILIPLVWLYLVKIAFPMKVKQISGGREIIRQEQKNLGQMSFEEKVVLTVFTLTALAWITRSFILKNYIPGIDDTIIALIGAFILFLVPAKNKAGNILDWDTVMKLPWGILWLFGGGLAIAAGISNSGLDQWIGSQLINFTDVPMWITLALIIGVITLLTEFTSNTATSTMVYPIVAAAAAALGTDPIILMVAACMGATFAFMFPVAAPPNAIVFATGYIKMSSMAKTGIWLNLGAIILSIIIVSFLVPPIFDGLIP